MDYTNADIIAIAMTSIYLLMFALGFISGAQR